MLVAERHQKIIERIEDKKIVRVNELSQLFSVTEETIRRDLEKLEREGYLIRSHGGAVLNERRESHDLPFEQREIIHVKEKRQIAAMAVRFVNQDDTIILDASTTAWYMARILPDMPLTVVTNALKVAAELSSKKKITVICTGGTLLTNSLSFVGPLASEALDQYYVNKAFISCKGMNVERGFTESNEQQALVKRKMLEISDQTFMMLDNSKINVQTFSKLASLEVANFLITNQALPVELEAKIKDHHSGLQMINSSQMNH
ncbi:DeoR/GlpR family DNA-binding transcription regulator [Amphibacillus sediminis]|uniref:DeoR/GlpR family DNA-binding transcription regulator n=1 Tax=Amphibacillus sediminis TaxID=360185 RepID=UPI00082C83FA|nr:DeoR/GlpR family DNA-binding transcription regulator [Amphibacillus sediminis]